MEGVTLVIDGFGDQPSGGLVVAAECPRHDGAGAWRTTEAIAELTSLLASGGARR